jgi:hypothetical protein
MVRVTECSTCLGLFSVFSKNRQLHPQLGLWSFVTQRSTRSTSAPSNFFFFASKLVQVSGLSDADVYERRVYERKVQRLRSPAPIS